MELDDDEEYVLFPEEKVVVGLEELLDPLVGLLLDPLLKVVVGLEELLDPLVGLLLDPLLKVERPLLNEGLLLELEEDGFDAYIVVHAIKNMETARNVFFIFPPLKELLYFSYN